MKDTYRIVAALKANPKLVDSATLATLVKVSGSYILKPGARMLIASDGTTIGAVSGGCIEADLIEQAGGVAQSGISKLLSYSAAGDDPTQIEAMAGCGGEVEMLLEPLTRGLPSWLIEYLNSPDAAATGALVTVVRVEGSCGATVGDRFLIDGEKTVIAGHPVSELALKDVTSVDDKAHTKSFPLADGSVELFIELVRPPVAILILGSNAVVPYLAEFAAQLGWQTTLVEREANDSFGKSLPLSERLSGVRPSEISQHLNLDRFFAALILTHHSPVDLEYLRALLPTKLKYIGLLGSRSRVAGVLESLRTAEPSLVSQANQTVRAPVGLDIGADDPAGIALSIIAEIQAALTNRSGGSLSGAYQ